MEPEVKMCFVKFWAEMYHAVRSNPVNEAIDRLVQENRSLEETVKMLEEAIKSWSRDPEFFHLSKIAFRRAIHLFPAQ